MNNIMQGDKSEKCTESRLKTIYKKLSKRYSPCNWWPAESSFEVIVGAILTQNTSWQNVEKALDNLKKICILEPENIAALSEDELANAIRPSGFYKRKAHTIKTFVEFHKYKYNYNINNIDKVSLDIIRKELLCIKGIGDETADCILLYAFNKPTFVVDAYTKRILTRAGIIENSVTNELLKANIENALQKDVFMYNEFHALFVNLGKEHCRRNPKCENCPINDVCLHYKKSNRDT